MVSAPMTGGLSVIPLCVVFSRRRDAVFIITGGKTPKKKTSGEVPFNHFQWVHICSFAFIPKPEAHKLRADWLPQVCVTQIGRRTGAEPMKR